MPHAKSLKQPGVFYLMFVAGLWERFGFYVVTLLIVLYSKQTLGLTDVAAFALFGVFSALCYITPPIGGYLADNIFGINRCLLLGMLLEAIGYTLISIPGLLYFHVALGCIIVGSGLFKACPTDIMARSYKKNDPRIDGSFTLFYMGTNIGCLLAAVTGGVIQLYYGWNIAFFTAAIGLYLGIIIIFLFRHLAKKYDSKPAQIPITILRWLQLIAGIVILCIFFAILTMYTTVTDVAIVVVVISFLLYLGYEIFKSPLHEKRRIIACIILMLMGIFFFMFFFQAYTSMVLFIQRNVNQTFLGITIPTPSYLAIDPFYIIGLSFVLAWLYEYLGKRKKDLAITTKFSVGLFAITAFFLLLAYSTLWADKTGQISSGWLLFGMPFYSIGELLIAALGVAMVTHIAPKRMYGVMMGAWYLIAWGLGATLSAPFASIAKIPNGITDPLITLHIYGHAFLKFAYIGLAVTIASILAGFYVNRLIRLGNNSTT